jgi:alpha-glucosidase (family GH31 glycosyl hydrolase)
MENRVEWLKGCKVEWLKGCNVDGLKGCKVEGPDNLRVGFCFGGLNWAFVALALIVGFSACNKPVEKTSEPGEIKFSETLPGVWSAAIGKPEAINYLTIAQNTPRKDALSDLPLGEFPDFFDAPEYRVKNGKTFIRIPLDRDEKIYGLGMHFKTVQQRGRIMRLHMDHVGDSDNGRTHAPVPFYVSSKGYGLLINAARYIDVWVGTAVQKDSKNPPEVKDRNNDRSWTAAPYSDGIEILIPADGAELVLFTGPEMIDAVKRYNLFNGGGPIPPKWGMGFWHRVPTLYTDLEVLNEVESFSRNDFPLDVIGLEPGWQSASYPCTYEWDPDRWPGPEKTLRDLANKGVRVNLWINPYIPPGSNIHNELKDFTGTHTVWAGEVPDYTIPEAREILKDHFAKNHLDIGVSGYKIDEVDGYDSWLWPDGAEFPSGIDGEQMRQIYALQMMQMINSKFEENNQRTWGLVRGNNAGGSRFPFVLYSDHYSHQDFITALVNSGFNGVMWTPEVRNSPSGEEWVRRMQTSCFSPMATINAWASGTKPWSFPEVYKEVQASAKLRLQMFPYFYSAFADYYFEGTPPFRAVQLENGFLDLAVKEKGELDGEKNPYALARQKEIKYQYMAGPNLLVAPLFAGMESVSVVLPPGKWFDFYTGEFVGEDEVITARSGLDKIPVFVRDGGMVPLIEESLQTPKPGEQTPVTIRVYGKTDGVYYLYDDDGSTFSYRNGKYNRVKISVTYEDGLPKTSIDAINPEHPWAYQNITFQYMTPQQTEQDD